MAVRGGSGSIRPPVGVVQSVTLRRRTQRCRWRGGTACRWFLSALSRTFLTGLAILLLKEIDHDPHAVFHDHAMGHPGRNCLLIADDEVDIDWRVRVHCEPHRTLQHPERGPSAVGDSMVDSQARRQGGGVEGPGSPNDVQTVRDFCSVAKRTVEVQAEALRATRLGQHPAAVPERWPVAHMLTVQAP